MDKVYRAVSLFYHPAVGVSMSLLGSAWGSVYIAHNEEGYKPDYGDRMRGTIVGAGIGFAAWCVSPVLVPVGVVSGIAHVFDKND